MKQTQDKIGNVKKKENNIGPRKISTKPRFHFCHYFCFSTISKSWKVRDQK